MLKILFGVVVTIISGIVILGGMRFIKNGRKKYAAAGIKVNFDKTPATFGFSAGITGSIIIIAGIIGFVWGLILI
ncbi:hypothetical protein ACLJJ6_10500 [Pediococcus siamensis]|uniref:hypothetical protein n=1 Tax=Pediococcus siamensis TaxID=381829 RepID=UPI0039A06452